MKIFLARSMLIAFGLIFLAPIQGEAGDLSRFRSKLKKRAYRLLPTIVQIPMPTIVPTSKTKLPVILIPKGFDIKESDILKLSILQHPWLYLLLKEGSRPPSKQIMADDFLEALHMAFGEMLFFSLPPNIQTQMLGEEIIESIQNGEPVFFERLQKEGEEISHPFSPSIEFSLRLINLAMAFEKRILNADETIKVLEEMSEDELIDRFALKLNISKEKVVDEIMSGIRSDFAIYKIIKGN